MRSLAPLFLLASSGLAALSGCVNTDANVFVAPTITSPTAMLTTSNPLGLGLSGAFDLGLDLSPRASGASTVSLGQVNLLDATMMPLVDPTTKKPIAQSLSATAAPPFPTTVQPGDDPMVSVTFNTDSGPLLPADSKALLCARVVIEVEIQDSLTETPKTAYSDPFQVSGCM